MAEQARLEADAQTGRRPRAWPVLHPRYLYHSPAIGGEDPGWVARVCGTSEQMIFRHYRNWIPGLQTGADRKISAALSSVIGLADGSKPSLKVSLNAPSEIKTEQNQGFIVVEAGGIEPPSEDLQELATTRLFRDLELALQPPTNGLP
jgi:hypothetical protein